MTRLVAIANKTYLKQVEARFRKVIRKRLPRLSPARETALIKKLLRAIEITVV